MAKLKFDSDWTEEQQVELSERLELTPELDERLFADQKTIVISAEQATEYVALVAEWNKETGGDDTGDTGATGDKAPVEEPTVDIHVRTQMEREAFAIGEAMPETTLQVIEDNYIADERTKVGTMLLADRLLKDEGKTIAEAKALILSWPEAGTDPKSKDESKHPHGQNRADYYHFKPAGTKKLIRKSFYQNMFDATTKGEALLASASACDKTLVDNKDNLKIATGPHSGMKKSEVTAERDLWNTRLKSGATQLRAAVAYIWQCYAFDNLSLVGYMQDRKSNGDVRNANKPIRIWSKEKDPATGALVPMEADNVTIKQFLKYDVAAATALAGGVDKVTVEHLDKTVERDTGGDDEGADDDKNKRIEIDGSSKLEIKNAEGVEVIYAALAAYFTNTDGSVNTKRESAVVQQCSKDEKYLLSFGEAATALDNVWNQVESLFRTAQAKKIKAMHDERIAKEKAAA